MKWVFYVVVFIYMCYRAVYGAKINAISSISVDAVDYGKFEHYLPPGSAKTIPCLYNNKNQQVEWIDPSGKPISQVKLNRIFTQKHFANSLNGRIPSLSLTFTDAWVEDSGTYECRSEGLSEMVPFCVIDPLTFVDTPSEVSVDEGRSFTLTCEARGRPEPRLLWYRNDEVISDDCNSTKYKVMTKFNSQGFQGQLTITSVEPNDAGYYFCEAIQEHKDLEDCSVSKTWNMTLNVNYAPKFEDTNDMRLYTKYNNSVDLNCEPKAFPTPTFRWFSEVDDGTLVNYPTDKVIASEDGTHSKITIVANAVSFGMKYVCRATNAFGYASKTFTVLELKKPKQPNEVVVFNATDSQVEVNVTWTDEILFPIDEIIIQCLKKEGKFKIPKESDWKRVKEHSFVLTEEENFTTCVLVSASDLEPETDYWIRLRAANELGYSPWSKPILVSTIEESEKETLEDVSEINAETKTVEVGEEEKDEARTDTMFYGIFFAGGILVISFLCMLAIRLI